MKLNFHQVNADFDKLFKKKLIVQNATKNINVNEYESMKIINIQFISPPLPIPLINIIPPNKYASAYKWRPENPFQFSFLSII